MALPLPRGSAWLLLSPSGAHDGRRHVSAPREVGHHDCARISGRLARADAVRRLSGRMDHESDLRRWNTIGVRAMRASVEHRCLARCTLSRRRVNNGHALAGARTTLQHRPRDGQIRIHDDECVGRHLRELRQRHPTQRKKSTRSQPGTQDSQRNDAGRTFATPPTSRAWGDRATLDATVGLSVNQNPEGEYRESKWSKTAPVPW